MSVRVALAAALLALSALPVRADERGPLPDHISYGRDACFALSGAAKPAGRIVGLHLAHDTVADPQAEDVASGGETANEIEIGSGEARLNAYFRLRTTPNVVHRQIVNCRKDETGVICGVDCDGGTFRLRPDGAGLTLASDNGMVLVGGCGAPEGLKEVVLQPKDLAGPFALTPRPIEQCRAERDAWRPAWAASEAPIRTRFTRGTECFARRYDKAHLAAHPNQTVTAISLKRLPVEGKIYPEQFSIGLKVTLRSGKTIARTGLCSAEDYRYSCIVDGSESELDAFDVTRAAGDRIAIRDEHKLLPGLLKTKLGSDDRTFLLDLAKDADCEG